MTAPPNFDDWLVAMDDRLDQLLDEVPESVSEKLDYSVQSLTVLEKWLISSYASSDDIMKHDKYLLDRLATYVGETFRTTLGGSWMVERANVKDVFYGLPIIKREGKPAEAPLTLVTAALHRRTGNYISDRY